MTSKGFTGLREGTRAPARCHEKPSKAIQEGNDTSQLPEKEGERGLRDAGCLSHLLINGTQYLPLTREERFILAHSSEVSVHVWQV